MPLKDYDRLYGGKGGAKKAMEGMVEQYGAKKGRQVFYATAKKKEQEKNPGPKKSLLSEKD
jgi:hypothetical protein